MRASSLRRKAGSERRLVSVAMPSSENAPPVARGETTLRVGDLELDLDRAASPGGRQIDLRPRELLLLKYMMRRSDKVLTRATLPKEVWNYKFVPETNLVDVRLGRLRRKVDAANETPMIRNIRGLGFVLSASLLSLASPPGGPSDQQPYGRRQASVAGPTELQCLPTTPAPFLLAK